MSFRDTVQYRYVVLCQAGDARASQVCGAKAYHGTNRRFTSFSPAKFGSGSGVLFGNGVYFTTSESAAKSYGKTSYEIDTSDFKFFDAFGDEDVQQEIANKAGFDVTDVKLNRDAFSNFLDAWHLAGRPKKVGFEDLVRQVGRDGMMIKGRPGSRIKPGETWYVVYNLDKLNNHAKKSTNART